MNLFANLFKYKLVRLYKYEKTRKDNRLNLGHDYKSNLLNNSLSKYIQRNDTMNTFILFLNDFFYEVIGSIKTLHNYKNYTVKKDDRNIR